MADPTVRRNLLASRLSTDSRARVLLWVVGAALATVIAVWTIGHIVPPTMVWHEVNGQRLLDYRDTVVHTTHFWLSGGNPYDPDTFLKAYPWSQEFDPYAPLWLLLVAPLGLMPLPVGGAIFVVLLLAGEAWFAVRAAQWAWPRHHRVLAPALYCWMMVWPPTRWVGASTLIILAIMGVLLSLRQSRETWWVAALAAVSCIKPQFGVPLLFFLLAYGRWRTVLRSVVVLLAGSAVPLLACIRSAGGLAGFVDSLRRDIAYASSAKAPTGMGSQINFRTDVPGILGRLGAPEWPGAWQIAFAATVLVAVALVLRRTNSPELAAVMISTGLLLLPVHADYDLALLVASSSGAIAFLRLHGGRAALALVVCTVLPVLHLHQVSMALGPSLDAVEALDVLCILVALALGLWLGATTNHQGESWQNSSSFTGVVPRRALL
ncbi:MAG: DUF2029 domain-containing protein [Luteococcus sp.]|uniref:glycosyltransferase family 87 protein n=1 Tax=Luteococcus sp. TaxID=1969402 RepID=UPI0026483543|nr:glycosyltransferase family 87 protein [Luteococcus sp.]MDN5563787.1 DUF2029 domain-containing protein [Luteococcus sp.]